MKQTTMLVALWLGAGIAGAAESAAPPAREVITVAVMHVSYPDRPAGDPNVTGADYLKTLKAVKKWSREIS